MDNDERTEIIDDYDVKGDSKKVSILKPLLAVLGVIVAGVGGFICFKKRKQRKYIELSTNNQNNQDDKYQDDDEEE